MSKNNKAERVACYIRVSTQEQKLHGLSLDAQRDTLTNYAKVHGLKIAEWYEDEGVSGRKLIKQRPALQRMLHDAQENKFARIIFVKIDRYFRSVAEYWECQKILETNNVTWTATEEKYDLSTANGRAFVNMKLTIAELEADQTGERIKLVNEYKVRSGQALMGSSSQGLGFMVQKDANGLKRVVKDPETAPHLEAFIDHFLTHCSKRGALEYVNDKFGTNYNIKNFEKKLDDTKIYGHYKGNDNYCEPYIDKATYDKIQGMKKKNIKVSANRKTYLFSGIIRCPDCGGAMVGKFCGKQVDKRPNGKTYVYHRDYYYYRCRKLSDSASCKHTKLIREDNLEEILLDKIDVYMTDYIAEAKVEDDTKTPTNTEDRITDIKGEMSRLTKAYRKNRITEEEYDRDYDKLEEKLHELQSQLEPVKERNLKLYEELLKSDWRAIYDALNKENKRAFWRKYLKQIHLTPEGNFDRVIFF
jgi:DNA invertase Pin-like site-specific DNA recombinase